jgi:hypothetical protein
VAATRASISRLADSKARTQDLRRLATEKGRCGNEVLPTKMIFPYPTKMWKLMVI